MNRSLAAAVAAVVLLCAFQFWWATKIQQSLQDVREATSRLEATSQKLQDVDERVRAMGDRLQSLAADFDVHVDDVQRLARRVDDLTSAFEGRTDTQVGVPPQPPQLDWTQPDLFEVARRGAESVGITLTEDEVRVPARFALRQGMLEYFAVLKGGKEHESLLTLVGNLQPDVRRPADFGVKLNNALMALGFTRGRPIRFSPTGTKPAQGDPVYLFLEWEEQGEKVLVRAEDLVWNRIDNEPMQSGHWVYVGSSFVPGDAPDEMIFAADLTAEVVATYSSPQTIIDTTAPGAQDDTVFLAATPRLPEGIDYVTLVFRRTDREPTRTFPPVDTDDPDGPVLPEVPK